jgi:rhodanese-related sulfurtransferase
MYLDNKSLLFKSTQTSIILLLLMVFSSCFAGEKNKPVNISPTVPSVEVIHQGIKVDVKRIQDTKNKLIDDFSKTSRPCPPFCIHPMLAAPNVETIGEIELLNFLTTTVKEGKGLLIDARMPKFYNSETIPGSINIPFILFTGDNSQKIISLLGVKKEGSTFDFSSAKELALFCNGPWCDQSPRAIKALVKAGYPASKLKYYRGGMQLWKIFSLTTVLPQSNSVEKQDKK